MIQANPLYGSVTLLIHRTQAGDQDAANDLFSIYIPKLLEIARRYRIARNSSSAGGSDFVASACTKFWCALVRGRLQTIESRDNLWPLLMRMTLQAAKSHARSELTLKRGAGEVVNASTLPQSVIEAATSLQQIHVKPAGHQRNDEGREPDHDLVEQVRNTFPYCDYVDSLPEDLQEIAVLKLLAHRNEEIAAYQGIAERTVERKLRLIRARWDK